MNRLNPFNFFNTRPIQKNYEDPPLKNTDKYSKFQMVDGYDEHQEVIKDKYSNFQMVDNEYDELQAVSNGDDKLQIVNPSAEKGFNTLSVYSVMPPSSPSSNHTETALRNSGEQLNDPPVHPSSPPPTSPSNHTETARLQLNDPPVHPSSPPSTHPSNHTEIFSKQPEEWAKEWAECPRDATFERSKAQAGPFYGFTADPGITLHYKNQGLLVRNESCFFTRGIQRTWNFIPGETYFLRVKGATTNEKTTVWLWAKIGPNLFRAVYLPQTIVRDVFLKFTAPLTQPGSFGMMIVEPKGKERFQVHDIEIRPVP
ncbi:MAG TPA: hypothetical protein VLE95_07080 [Chlamydiales bacterium]|nr:hypothetical protein [Chlamydiales bacterium]